MMVSAGAVNGDPPRLRLAPLCCPPRGSNSRLGAALRRSWRTHHWGSSYIQEEIDDGEDAVNDDEQDDARNDRPRCGIADGRGAGRRLQATQAADAGDQDREDERLDETGHEVGEVNDALDLVNERHERNRER